MADPPPPPPFGDTTWTKVFVGGLAWETQSDEMHSFFKHFGDILEAVIIKDKNTAKSKGYGFVTFRDPESARRACANPNPIICGRRANCNIAAFGRPRPPPPSPGGRNLQSTAPATAGSYGGLRPPFPPPSPPQVIFPSYRYRSYAPNYTAPNYHQHQAIYNPQLQQPQVYSQSPTSSSSSSYYYGYGYSSSSSQTAPRGAFSIPSASALSYYPNYYTNYTHNIHQHQSLFYTPMHQIITPTTTKISFGVLMMIGASFTSLLGTKCVFRNVIEEVGFCEGSKWNKAMISKYIWDITTKLDVLWEVGSHYLFKRARLLVIHD